MHKPFELENHYYHRPCTHANYQGKNTADKKNSRVALSDVNVDSGKNYSLSDFNKQVLQSIHMGFACCHPVTVSTDDICRLNLWTVALWLSGATIEGAGTRWDVTRGQNSFRGYEPTKMTDGCLLASSC